MSRKKKLPTQEEIDAILFHDTDESDLEEEDDGWGDYIIQENDESFEVPEMDDIENEKEKNLPIIEENKEINWMNDVTNVWNLKILWALCIICQSDRMLWIM